MNITRSSERMTRQNFELIFSLTDRQPWLRELHEELFDLIDECVTGDEQDLICDLISRFHYVDSPTFASCTGQMVSCILENWKLCAENTAICARETGHFADSSQYMVYALKGCRWNSQDWNTTSFVSKLSAVVDIPGATNIILVDEFVGTGESAEKSVHWTKSKLAEVGREAKIYFMALAGMELGLARLSPQVDGIFCCFELKRGISDHYEPADVDTKIATMKESESRLAQLSRRGKLAKHSLGYKESESLYARAGGNTPNNVFPIFWWEEFANGKKRFPLLQCV